MGVARVLEGVANLHRSMSWRAVYIIILFSFFHFAQTGLSPLLRAERDADKTGRYIVLLQSNISDEDFNKTLKRALSLSQDKRPYVVVRFVEKAFTLDLNSYALHQLRRWPEVRLVEEETEAVGTQDPTVPWHLDLLDQDPAAYLDHQYSTTRTGEGIDAYIADTGINFNHEEFKGRAKYLGYDPYDEYQTFFTSFHQHGWDCNGHGTHVASLLGGAKFGSAKSVSLFSVRVLNCFSRAPWSVILDGLDHIMKMVSIRKRPSVVNLSLGGRYQQSVNNAMQTLAEAGVVIVAAAGNGAETACSQSPASSFHVITVGGTNRTNGLYSYTNYGVCVDIFAPGVHVQGAHYKCNSFSVEYPTDVREDGCSLILTGTSMSTPLVGGVVAGMLEERPLLKLNEALSLLKERGRRGVIKGALQGSPNLLLNTPGSCGGYYPFRVQLNLMSPGYPNGYPLSLQCEWHIPAAYNEDIGVLISDLELERGFDYLYLCQDGNCTSYTGNQSGIHYRTSNKNLTIRLVTDDSISRRGFKLTFTKYYIRTPLQVIDGGELTPPLSTSLPLATTHTFTEVSTSRIKSLVEEMKRKSFDILSVSTAVSPDDSQWYYTVLFHNSTQTPSQGFVELQSHELNRTLQDQISTKALIPYSIVGRLSGPTPLYSAVFRKYPSFIESHAYWDVTIPAHVMSRVNMEKKGWELMSQHFIVFGGESRKNETRVCAVYHRDLRRVYNVPLRDTPITDKESYYGFLYPEFTSVTLSFLYQDYYAKHISTYYHDADSPAQGARFSVILEKKVAGERSDAYWIRWGLNSSAVHKEIERFSNIWDLVYIVSYVYENTVQYILEWGRKIGH